MITHLLYFCRFKSKGELDKHIVTHSTIKPFHCQICDKAFKTKVEVRLHSNVHKAEKPHSCDHPSCESKFKTKQELKRHQISHIPKRFKCSICFKSLRDKKSLNRHEDLHAKYPHKLFSDAPRRLKNFECDSCHKIYNNRTNFRRHVSSVHINALTRPFTCDRCGKTYKSKDEVKKHLLVHFGSKIYKCTICQMSFKRGFGLNKHLKVHKKRNETDRMEESTKQGTGILGS